MDTLTPPETGSGNPVEALDSVTRELAALEDPSQVAERALAIAIDLTHASVAFIALDDEPGGRRRVYSTAADPSTHPSEDEIEGLMTATTTHQTESGRNGRGAAPHESFCGEPLVAAGRTIGTMGVVSPLGFTALQRSAFAVLAHHVAASFEMLGSTSAGWRWSTPWSTCAPTSTAARSSA